MPSRTSPRRRAAATVLAAVLAGFVIAAPGGASQAGKGWWMPTDRPSPDSEINVTGAPFKGTDANGDVRGFVDAHNHLFSNLGNGGKFICGKPYSEAGIADALKDCAEHHPNGALAANELFLGGDATHDPVGWPTFKYWPSYKSLTHQQNYYAWLERAWRGGQRILVNDLVANYVLCALWPVKDQPCDEMATLRIQAQATYDMQGYIDEMYGGPGKGWFRIVTNPGQAIEVVKQGKLAVVLGVETSEPFGCWKQLEAAQCTKADIDAGLDEFQALGVSSMFLCHKFDNALCGVSFDSGTTGVVVNTGQFLRTGSFWKTEQCDGPEEDNPISSAPAPPFLAGLLKGVPIPVNSPDHKCNVHGLTELGEYALRGMLKRNMIVELDHMSVKAVGQTLDILESASYPGVVSSHSWMDTHFTERLYKLGGFVAVYPAQATAFGKTWKETDKLRDRYNVGYGYGMDMNGLGGSPAPRGVPNAVRYPFRTFDGGSLVDRQSTGQRTWDINVDGVAHVGLVPDWIEDLRQVNGRAVVDDLARGAQSYLDTWCATQNHQASKESCRHSKPVDPGRPNPGDPSTAPPDPSGQPGPGGQPTTGGPQPADQDQGTPGGGSDASADENLAATGAPIAAAVAVALAMLCAGLCLLRRRRSRGTATDEARSSGTFTAG